MVKCGVPECHANKDGNDDRSTQRVSIASSIATVFPVVPFGPSGPAGRRASLFDRLKWLQKTLFDSLSLLYKRYRSDPYYQSNVRSVIFFILGLKMFRDIARSLKSSCRR